MKVDGVTEYQALRVYLHNIGKRVAECKNRHPPRLLMAPRASQASQPYVDGVPGLVSRARLGTKGLQLQTRLDILMCSVEEGRS